MVIDNNNDTLDPRDCYILVLLQHSKEEIYVMHSSFFLVDGVCLFLTRFTP